MLRQLTSHRHGPMAHSNVSIRRSDHGLSVLMLRPLAQAIRNLGDDPAVRLERLGVGADTSVDAYVSATAVDEALDAMARARGDSSFGVTLALAAGIIPFGFFGHLTWAVPTLGDGLSRVVQFFALLSARTSVQLVVSERVATVTQRTVPSAQRGTILTEFFLATLVLRARAATGKNPRIRAVRFMHAPVDTATYDAHFQAPITFSAAADEIEIEASDLALPLLKADPTAAAVLEQQGLRMLAALTPVAPFVESVRATILRGLRSPDRSLARLARELSLSERTLQRRLEEHGTSHRDLADDVRREVACHLLARESKSSVEVAYELGFATPRAFHKAFVRWTGMTPGAFRHGHAERGR